MKYFQDNLYSVQCTRNAQVETPTEKKNPWYQQLSSDLSTYTAQAFHFLIRYWQFIKLIFRYLNSLLLKLGYIF